MDEFLWLRMLGGGFAPVIDLPALIAFIAFAVIYLILPVLGFPQKSPKELVASLYLLVGYAAISLVQMLTYWIYLNAGRAPPGARSMAGSNVLLLLSFTKMTLFVLALLAFAWGLHSVRLRPPYSEDE
jgi:hypothetical protein